MRDPAADYAPSRLAGLASPTLATLTIPENNVPRDVLSVVVIAVSSLDRRMSSETRTREGCTAVRVAQNEREREEERGCGSPEARMRRISRV